ncbi:MAG: hypothetical protein PWR13_554 [Archaeoglobi archaeon]|nr:hypothetical protein [Candidatus Mnemosynella bozhongmuii]MDI3502016.1 hypothetical protein [Archaeoglobi archaeon]MDK2781526.1 hypothetical protein [Archaeoglobi archaeon]
MKKFEEVWRVLYRNSDYVVANDEVSSMDGPLSEKVLNYVITNRNDFMGQTTRAIRLVLFRMDGDGKAYGDIISIWEKEGKGLPRPDWERCLGVMKYLAETLGGTLLRNKEGTKYLLVIDDQAIQ